MIRREILDKHDIKFTSGVHIGEDILFWIAVAKKGQIDGIDEILTSVRVHDTNAANNISALIQAKKSFINRALIPDVDVSRVKKRIIKSKLEQGLSGLYFADADFFNAVQHILHAIRSCPFRLPMIVTYAGKGVLKKWTRRFLPGKKNM
jgi:hypothetical protein